MQTDLLADSLRGRLLFAIPKKGERPRRAKSGRELTTQDQDGFMRIASYFLLVKYECFTFFDVTLSQIWRRRHPVHAVTPARRLPRAEPQHGVVRPLF